MELSTAAKLEIEQDLLLDFLELRLSNVGKKGYSRAAAHADTDHFRRFLEARRGKTWKQLRREAAIKHAAFKARCAKWRELTWPSSDSPAARAARLAEVERLGGRGSKSEPRTAPNGEPLMDWENGGVDGYRARLAAWNSGVQKAAR
jgi:hypothetical protein